MALAPEIASFGDGDHAGGETGLTITGGGFGAFPGSAWIYQNADRTGLSDQLTVGTWNDIELTGVEIPASPNNSPGTVYLFVEREDLAWSQAFAFTLSATSFTLTIADASHEHTADSLALTQGNTLSIADALHAHAADGITLTQANVLAVAAALHEHTAGNVALVQAHVLAVGDAQHAHSAGNVTLAEGAAIDVANALHEHLADGVALTQAHLLAVAAAFHAHSTGSISLTQANTLIVSNALHEHLANNISLHVGSRPYEASVFVIQAQRRTFVVTRN